MENIAGYVYDHTTCNARSWRQAEPTNKVRTPCRWVHSPRRAEFLRYVRLHAEKNPCCNPLDGRVHSLKEVTSWIGIRELALRFIGLGVILGVFELVRAVGEARAGEPRGHDQAVRARQRCPVPIEGASGSLQLIDQYESRLAIRRSHDLHADNRPVLIRARAR